MQTIQEDFEPDAREKYGRVYLPVNWREARKWIIDQRLSWKEISWNVLDRAEKTDSFALRIFEYALDYGVGKAIYEFMHACVKHGKKASKFFVIITRGGRIGIAIKKEGEYVTIGEPK